MNTVKKIFRAIFKNAKPRIEPRYTNETTEDLKNSTQDSTVAPKRTLAEMLHESYWVRERIEDLICEAYEKYEPEVYEHLDFTIGADDYDNSIEIYFKVSLPYPYEPCKEIRESVYAMGFSNVYWNFLKDTMDVFCDRVYPPRPDNIWKDSPDEIRNWEPRHNKYAHWESCKYGYVDARFDKKEWESKYSFRNK